MDKINTFDLKRIDEETMEGFIVNSLLEDDFYKFSMGGFIYDLPEYRNITVKWQFKNRTKDVRLADHIDEKDFFHQIDHIRKIQATKTELHYLRGTNEYDVRMFDEKYLEHLGNIKWPEFNFSKTNGGQLDVNYSAKWLDSMHGEIFTLRIIKGLYVRSLLKKKSRGEREAIYAEGIRRLFQKITLLRQKPYVTFSDFGNRRCFSTPWHEYVVSRIAEELPKQFVGTSNTMLAAKYDLMPTGTCAHELSMIFAAHEFDGSKASLENSFRRLHELWWKKYGHGLSIFLPDTFGSKFALRVLPDELFKTWKGPREDSMGPIPFGEMLISKYKSLGVDSREKIMIPSDGLEVMDMINVTNHFLGRLPVSFGWGTSCTSDLPVEGLENKINLSLIIKPLEADGKSCVKLSDNEAKNMGKEVAAYRNAAEYDVTKDETCVY